MTLMCIDRSLSPTHKGNFLQGGKSPVGSHHHHHRRSSCSPPLHHKEAPPFKSGVLEATPGRKLERSASEPERRNSNSSTNSSNGSGVQQQQPNSSRYKTELCRPFEESGTCKYGDKCQFAHGAKELRSMARHPKYKTELCRTFHSTGLCPYGPRCHFIHNSDQARKSLLTVLAPAPRPSLGSAGDVSPASSHGGTPTGLKSFDDLYQTPLSPTLSTGSGGSAFTFQQDLAALVSCLNQRFVEIPPDNHQLDGGVFGSGGPVLDLIGSSPAPSSPADLGLLHMPLFEYFHRPLKQQQQAI